MISMKSLAKKLQFTSPSANDEKILFRQYTSDRRVLRKVHKRNRCGLLGICIAIFFCTLVFLLILVGVFMFSKYNSKGLCGRGMCILVSLTTIVGSEDESRLLKISSYIPIYERNHLNNVILYEEWTRNEFQNRNSYLRNLIIVVDNARSRGIQLHYYLGMMDYSFFIRQRRSDYHDKLITVSELVERIYDLTTAGVKKIILGSILNNIIEKNTTNQTQSMSHITRVVNMIVKMSKNFKTVPEIYVDLMMNNDDEVLQVTQEIEMSISLMSGILYDGEKAVMKNPELVGVQKLPNDLIYNHVGNVMARGDMGQEYTAMMHQFLCFLPGSCIIYSDNLVSWDEEIDELQRSITWKRGGMNPTVTLRNYTFFINEDVIGLYQANEARKSSMVFVGKLSSHDYSVDLQSVLDRKKLGFYSARIVWASRTYSASMAIVDAYSLPMKPGEYLLLDGYLYK